MVFSERWFKKMFFCDSHGCWRSSASEKFEGFRQHRAYLRHLQLCPKLGNRIMCKYRSICKETFPTLKALRSHIKMRHVKNNTGKEYRQLAGAAHTEHTVVCQHATCGGSMFRSIRDLKLHILNSHRLDEKYCFFENCSYTSASCASFRMHFARKHRDHGYPHLRASHYIEGNIPTTKSFHV